MEMSEHRQLMIIAGPNGAGKSTISYHFADQSAILFDPDKESQIIRDKFRGVTGESIYYAINNHFQDKISEAVGEKRDFILETNFRDHHIMDVVEQFKSHGYEANLMYFLLRSESESLDRVTERVNDGGHFVDNISIGINYNEGLKNLIFFAPRFDRVAVFNASARIGTLQPILNIAFQKIKFVNPVIPDWAQSIIDSLKGNYPSKDRNPGEDTPPTGVNR
jgi:predicted ABC-type ATPase